MLLYSSSKNNNNNKNNHSSSNNEGNEDNDSSSRPWYTAELIVSIAITSVTTVATITDIVACCLHLKLMDFFEGRERLRFRNRSCAGTQLRAR